MRKLDTGPWSADGSDDNSTILAQTAPHIPPAVEDVDLQLPAAVIEHGHETPSARHVSTSSTPVDPEMSSVSSIPSQLSDSGSRPQRSRHPPKTFES
jgi:hypothetical protein